MKEALNKIVHLLERLSSKPQIDGLEISDGGLAYVYFEGETPKTAAVRLPPGVVQGGKLMDKAAFGEALKTLHAAIAPDSADKLLKIDCVLPSSAVYTQSFEVPNVGEGKMDETVGLNLQMISPIAVGQANMSAQLIGETPDQYELLGAFAEQATVDAFKDVFALAHFAPVAFEFSSLALARIITKTTKIGPHPVLVLHLKSDGIDLAILRDGHLHFSYFRSWQSVQGSARTISRELFDGIIVEEVRKVVNFAVSRWGEGPNGVLLVAPNFEAEITNLLAANFTLRSTPFVLPSGTPASNFYVALGAAERSRMADVDEPFRTINVGGEGLTRAMAQDQLLSFIVLWRNIVAGALAIVLLAYIFSASFLVGQTQSLANRLNAFNPPAGNTQTLATLSSEAQTFNGLVRGVAAAQAANIPWYAIFNHLLSLANQNQVVLSDVSVTNFTSPVQVSATAPNYATVLQFKNALSADPNFSNVDLPLTQVTTIGNGNVGFNVSFNFTSVARSLK